MAIIRGWGCGFGNSEHIVTWSDNRPSFTVLGFMAVVAYCRTLTTGLVVKPNYKWENYTYGKLEQKTLMFSNSI
jgi:hypothetical protein